MFCCVECFRDSEIRRIIESIGKTGSCDFCSSKDVAIYDIGSTPNQIADLITRVVQVYSVSSSTDAKPLKIALRDDWNIFNVGSETIQSLAKKLCESSKSYVDEVFSKNVYIPQLADNDFLNEFGVVHEYSWALFSKSIKSYNRFHSRIFNADAFASLLSVFAKVYPANSQFSRARISTKDGFPKNEMGAPPEDKRIAGRINPEGIGVLYLSSDSTTALNEVRASTFDYVTIGLFQNLRDVKVSHQSLHYC
jgi:hypothetical protein